MNNKRKRVCKKRNLTLQDFDEISRPKRIEKQLDKKDNILLKFPIIKLKGISQEILLNADKNKNKKSFSPTNKNFNDFPKIKDTILSKNEINNLKKQRIYKAKSKISDFNMKMKRIAIIYNLKNSPLFKYFH